MQDESNASNPPAPSAVRGLGVVDALCVELEPGQVAWLADEVDVVAGCAAERLDRLPPDAGEQELAAHAYRIEVLAMVRAQLPEGAAGSISVVAPAATMRELIAGAARNTAEALGEALADEPQPSDAATAARLRALAAAAAGFAERLAAMRDIEAYSFDPRSDPAP